MNYRSINIFVVLKSYLTATKTTNIYKETYCITDGNIKYCNVIADMVMIQNIKSRNKLFSYIYILSINVW